MATYFIKTFGCKTNQIESEYIAKLFDDNGFSISKNIENADYIIINSCSVTGISESENIRFVKNCKHKNPNSITILTGCVAQLKSNELKNILEIDYIFGNDEKFEILDLVKKHEQFKVSDIEQAKIFRDYQVSTISKSRASIKIQDGCNNRCSYCTIPLARGFSRSNTIENIIRQVNEFNDNQYKEVILTGINIGLWGKDLGKFKLLDLLKEIEKTEIKQYRLGSLGVHDLNDEFIEFLSKSDKFCPHFHLSLQSLCDKTLKNMNRFNTADEALNLISKINDKFENPFIGSDIIVGFPDETEDDFLTTLNNAKISGLSQIHVFPYSVRENTKAEKMPNQIQQNIKKERLKQLQEVSDKHLERFLNNNINTIRNTIILKSQNQKMGIIKGITDNYIKVIIENPPQKIENIIYKTQLLRVENNNIISKIVI